MGYPPFPDRQARRFAAIAIVVLTAGASCSTAEGQASPVSARGPVSVTNNVGLRAASTTTSSLAADPTTDSSISALVGEEPAPTPPAPTPPDPATPLREPVTIAFGGDIHFERMIATALDDDPSTVLSPVAEMMADADIAIANLETAVTDRGTASAKQFNFRTGPAAFEALRAAGIDVVSMANNHGMDYGLVGLEDSLAHAAAADFPVIGIGADADAAYGPWSHVVNGQRIAVIGATQVLDSSLIASWTATDEQPGLASAKEVERLVAEVRRARLEHDTVIVYLHWGIEGETCPAPRQIELSDQLIEAGADVIVGGHAHRLQGGGRKGEAFVHYGLGNFVFYTESGPGADSGVLLLTVNGRSVDDYEWIPARLQSGVATALDADSAPVGIDNWESLRSCTDLEP